MGNNDDFSMDKLLNNPDFDFISKLLNDPNQDLDGNSFNFFETNDSGSPYSPNNFKCSYYFLLFTGIYHSSFRPFFSTAMQRTVHLR